MKIYLYLFAVLVVALIASFAWTRLQVQAIAEKYPPIGSFAGSTGERLHFVDLQLAPGESGPTVLFLHGASGNLLDQMLPLLPARSWQLCFRLVWKPCLMH